jgi:hypothetical protein
MTHPWPELSKTALLGTERQGEPPRPSGALAPVFARIYDGNGADRERALLDALAVTALYQRCGSAPPKTPTPAAEPCAPEARSAVNNSAARHLALILGGNTLGPLLPEWLTAVDAAGKRVSERLVPVVLDAGVKKKELREAIQRAVGQRGAWLARFNKDWAYIEQAEQTSEEQLARTWEEGEIEARARVLREWRARDATQTRALIEHTWKDEPAKHRALFVESLRIGLSAADEPFLEAALDDKSKDVRQQAAALLSMLSDSAFAHRMHERLDAALTFSEKKGLLGKLSGKTGTLEVAFADDWQKAWERDGVSEKPPAGKGKKAWWLEQMLGYVAPAHFCTRWNQTPAALIAASEDGEWASALLPGWHAATLRHHDAQWAAAFIARDSMRYAELWASIPRDRREALYEALLKQCPNDELADLIAQLPYLDRTWTVPFSVKVAQAFRQLVDHRPAHASYGIYGALRAAALLIAPATVDELEKQIHKHLESDSGWSKILNEVLELVRFRRDMLQAIAD